MGQFEQMHEVTVVTVLTVAVPLKRATLSFAEICNRRKLCSHDFAGIVATVDSGECILSGVLIGKFDIGVSGKVLGEIFANVHIVYDSILGHFVQDIAVEVFEMVEAIVWRYVRRRVTLGDNGGRNLLRSLVEVREKNGLAEDRFVVDPGASIAVATSASLDVEGAVDLVLFGAVDRGEVVGHSGVGAGGDAARWRRVRRGSGVQARQRRKGAEFQEGERFCKCCCQ